MKYNKILILPLLLILLVFGCKNTLIQTEDITSEQYGSLIIGDKTESRALKIENIKGAKVSVSGNGFSDLSTTTLIKDGAITGVTINGIPVGKNRVVTVHAGTEGAGLTDADLMSGVVMRAVTDINAGANSVTVNWSTTALGNIFYELFKLGYDISEITAEQKSSLVYAIPTSVHATLVNAKAIAEDFMTEGLKDSSAYALTGGTVKFDVDVTDYNDYIVQVTDPASNKLIPVSAGEVTGITPGTWDLVVWSNNNFEWCRASQITVAEGEVVDFGTLEFVTPKPIFTPASCFFTDSLKISIAAEDGATVYYTTDDSEPTLYTVPFTITENTTVKAFAKIEGLEKSAIVTEEYNKASLGYRYPAEGPYSAVDMNGDKDGNGWNTLKSEPGVTINDDGTVTFAVYSANAERILLEIYEEAYGENADAKYDYWMEKGSEDDYWRAKVAGVQSGTLYAFRAWGPNWKYSEEWTRGNSDAGYISDYDAQGNRFNPNKVLFDPYAKEISHDKSHPDVLGTYSGTIYATGEKNLIDGKPSREFDSGKYAPKSVVIDDKTSFVYAKPNIPQEKAIIYEAHARGITKHESSANLSSILSGISGFEGVVDIPTEYQGTYKGAGMLAPYLKALGVNTIELLPVHESDNDANPEDKHGGNYWAYMTYGYFAPDRRYSSDKSLGGPTKEFKEMVDAFHAEGIEVYLDVVFNHSGEGGTWYSKTKKENGIEVPNPEFDNYQTVELTFMRGLDNSSWYCLPPAAKGSYWETTGCGNNLQCDNPIVGQMILDSLKYWIDEMGVDGYRFDLAPVVGREFDGTNWNYNPNAQLLKDIASLGASRNAEMIAEAWDIGAYGVGTFPAGWGEWNGRYRDALRGYIGTGNKSGTDKGDFLQYMNGDYNNFNDQGGPHKSVNFVVAHDGFTLADLCSYEGNGNAQNSQLDWPFGKSDGGNGDYNSLGFGTTPAAKRQANRNYIAIQMMSRGVPMIVWGDEFSRTQNGNNNPYNIDSVATWSNYNMINTKSPHLVATGGAGSYHNNFGTFNNTEDVNGNFMFMKYMLALKANEPALNQADYGVGYDFKKEDGKTDLTDGDRCVWVRINGSGVTGTDSEGNTVQGSDYLVFMNMYTEAVPFSVPTANGAKWKLMVDTSSAKEANFNYWEVSNTSDVYSSVTYSVPAWSVVIMKNYGTPTTSTPVIEYEADADNKTMEVTINCSTAGATIYYKEGTGSYQVYNGPFNLNVSTAKTITAYATKADYIQSGETSRNLFIDEYKIYCKPSFNGTPYAHVWKVGGSDLTTWPGAEMKPMGDGWYELEVVDVNQGYDRVIFNDGSSEKGKQTADLEFDKSKPYFKMTGSFTGGWVANKNDTPVPVKLTFTNNKRWSGTIYAYFYHGTTPVGAAWPGSPMTKSYTNDFGEDIYTVTVPTGASMVIFNNGSSQTVDIPIPSKDTKYYVDEDGSNVKTW
ncbi:MAG: starch-binding protein [Treponemataceae bacterium]|nr:starch-binding protein [Treponemataceae bacterium]